MKNQTKQLILNSFNEIMEKKPFEKITVEEVCRHADISKPTFYRYYRDKYDVMTYNFQLLFEHYYDLYKDLKMEKFLSEMYRSTQENIKPIRQTFDILGRNSMNEVIYSLIVAALVDKVAGMQDGTITSAQQIQCDILAYGISYIGENWVSGKYDITPEEAAAATLELIPPQMR